MKTHLVGFYGTRIYLPFSRLSREFKKRRNKPYKFLQKTSLSETSWKKLTKCRLVKIQESAKSNGNIRISELGILCAFASECKAGSNLFEIGTFDGRTTLNLAYASPESCFVHTLDLPEDFGDTQFSLASGESHLAKKENKNSRFDEYQRKNPDLLKKINRHFSDSATFDFTPYHDSCSLTFVDGSHAYEYVRKDTDSAIKITQEGGIVIWHDYGIWEGVTQALEEMEEEFQLGLQHVKGTSLVYWTKPTQDFSLNLASP